MSWQLNETKAVIIVLAKSTPNILIACFLLVLPFSHAPSIYGPYFTLPFIVSVILILYFFKDIFFLKEGLAPVLAFYLFILIMFANSLYFNSNGKLLQYIFAYTWFTLFILVSISMRKYFTSVPTFWIKAIVVGIIISIGYNILELYMNLRGNGLSPIPRYDRSEYVFYSPVGFRVRGFNYESSNYALYISVVFSFLFFRIKNYLYQLFLVCLWAALLLLTFSSLHMFLFLFFILPLLMYYGHYKFKLIMCASILIVMFVFVFNFADILMQIIDVIFSKLFSYIEGSGLESGEVRNQLLTNGINQIKSYPLFGEGLASFYKYQESGYNNVYIQTFQQLGILGGGSFCLFLLYPLF